MENPLNKNFNQSLNHVERIMMNTTRAVEITSKQYSTNVKVTHESREW